MLSGIHGYQRHRAGGVRKAGGPTLRAEAERLGASPITSPAEVREILDLAA